MLVSSLVLAIGVTIYSCAKNVPAVSKPAPVRAFLNADWGMSPSQISEANRIALEPTASDRQFYTPEPGKEGHYRTLEARNYHFFGYPAVVSYSFIDDRLFAYHVSLTGASEEMDDDIRGYLERTFGKGTDLEDENSRLKQIWQKPERVVNYWFYEEDLALVDKFKAVFGVSYRPLEKTSS